MSRRVLALIQLDLDFYKRHKRFIQVSDVDASDVIVAWERIQSLSPEDRDRLISHYNRPWTEIQLSAVERLVCPR
jgi:hypothetical protein